MALYLTTAHNRMPAQIGPGHAQSAPTFNTPATPDAAGPTRNAPLGLILFALAMGGFGIGTTEFATMGVLPLLAGDLGASIPQAGHAVSAYAMGVVIGAPLIAAVTSRMPRRRLLLTLVALFAMGNLASLLAPSMPLLVGARFLAGLPHGGYLGGAAVVAASLVAPERRGRAMARVGLGMTVANIVGVPAAAALGSALGWRSAYGLVVVVALATLAALRAWLPRDIAYTATSVKQEFATLARPKVWLALVAGSIGNCGQFAVYTYISPIVTRVAGLPEGAMPWVLALYGVGMTFGAFIAGPLIDKSVDRASLAALGGLGVVLLVFGSFTTAPGVVLLALFLIAAGGCLFSTSLQARLFRDAYDAPSLSAAMNHSAFNMSNALGAFLGGLLIEHGLGYRAPAFLGVVFIVLGIGVLVAAKRVGRADRRSPSRAVLSLDGEAVPTLGKRARVRAAGVRLWRAGGDFTVRAGQETLRAGHDAGHATARVGRGAGHATKRLTQKAGHATARARHMSRTLAHAGVHPGDGLHRACAASPESRLRRPVYRSVRATTRRRRATLSLARGAASGVPASDLHAVARHEL